MSYLPERAANAPDIRATLAVAAGLVLLFVAGFFLPGSLNWGFHFLGFLPSHFALVYLGGIIWAAFFILRGNPDELLAKLTGFFVKTPIQFLLGTLALLTAFAFLLRVQAPLLGDSFFLLKNYLEASKGTSPLFPRDEPLATYYFSAALRISGASTYKEYLDAFLGADLLLGLGFVVNVMFIARHAVKEPVRQFFTFTLLLVLPYTQLFLGYVETYPVVLFTLSLYLAVAFAYLDGSLQFYWIPPAFLLMALSHYLSSLLFVSLFYITILAYRKREFAKIWLGYGIGGASLLVLLRIVDYDIGRFSSWVPYSHFLSVFESLDPLVNYAQAYTLFSFYHAVDLFNLLILLAPFPAYMIVSRLLKGGFPVEYRTQTRFLAGALIPVIAFLVLVKFDLGAARDWDVFSPYALPFALLGAVVYFGGDERKLLRDYAVIALVTLFHSFLFFYVNADARASLKRYMSFFDRRTLSQNGFYGASLQLSMYYRETHRPSEPQRIWEHYVKLFPDDPRGYGNVIANLSPGTDDGEILRLYEGWYARNPDDPDVRSAFSQFALDAGNRNFSGERLEEAKAYYLISLRIDPDDARACNNLGSVLAEQKQYDPAIAMFSRALAIDSGYTDALHNIGEAYMDRGQKAKGIGFLRTAARLGHAEAGRDLDSLHIAR